MEVPNAMTPMQLTLICVLSSFLVAWTVTSLWLALRPHAKQKMLREEIRVPLAKSQISNSTQQLITQAQLRASPIVSDASREIALERSQ
jgi:histidine ammonia-lyase